MRLDSKDGCDGPSMARDLPPEFNGLESQQMRDCFLAMRRFLEHPGDADGPHALIVAALLALQEAEKTYVEYEYETKQRLVDSVRYHFGNIELPAPSWVLGGDRHIVSRDMLQGVLDASPASQSFDVKIENGILSIGPPK